MSRLVALAVLVTMICGSAVAQSPAKVYRLGLLSLNQQSVDVTREHTLPELARLGFAVGRNLTIEWRIGNPGELVDEARALVAAHVDVIIAIGSDAVRSARIASTTIPIVMFGDDPVGLGFAESLARPGHNVTGVTILVAELDAKRLQLLHEAVPSARKVGALLYATQASRLTSMRVLGEVATGAGLNLVFADTTGPADYPAAFARLRAAGVELLVIGPSPVFFRDSEMLAGLALEARLPAACEWAEMALSGCLIGFGPNRRELRRRLAHFVARIFTGANPGDLPIEGPTSFELAINLQTARAIGIEIPSTLLSRADEVIE